MKINFIENFLEIGKKDSASDVNGSAAAKDPSGKQDKAATYAAAYQTFKSGNYPKAREAFQGFLAAYPSGEYSDNAQFDYNMNNDLGKMVLNPDVIVRSRGVMEKCTMCVQRIQYGKLEAKKAGRRPKDGEIQTACAQACPTHAITFGDYNDKQSGLASQAADPRAYHVLEEYNVQPSIIYQTKVRNRDNSAKA